MNLHERETLASHDAATDDNYLPNGNEHSNVDRGSAEDTRDDV